MQITQLDYMIYFCKCFDRDKLAVKVSFQSPLTFSHFLLSFLLCCMVLNVSIQFICFLLNLILGASSSEFHPISSTSESPQNQEELKKWKQKTKIVETEKLKGENKIKRCIKLLWKVFVNSNNNLLFDKALKNYLNAVMWCQYYFKSTTYGEQLTAYLQRGCEC